ncbi:hypothetical protein DCCM_4842 [Desulfocucumis palustris]|uniref:Uncharacterized protein n=1 Tax=Desulfocucumis palustris TaxID=1898651 RepID=A0A2L2XJ29_9FIRM|nr:hypothetical protein DCCM_4842 [Desulfocucumis palustris]
MSPLFFKILKRFSLKLFTTASPGGFPDRGPARARAPRTKNFKLE